jgi:hypothetical protein
LRSEIEAYFRIIGDDVNPAEVTVLTGLPPDKTWKIGELRVPNATIRHHVNAWIISSGLPNSAGLTDHLLALVERLRPALPALTDISHRHRSEIDCVIKSYDGDRPEIYFDHDIVNFAAQVNAVIGIDLYIM